MAKNRLEGIKESYDVIVIGSGLGGLTSANSLAKCGHSVLLLEHHYQYGGLSTWFRRKGGHIFDISLHGFPYGMVKSCRKYWSKEIADSIFQIENIRFENPQFSINTKCDKEDFKNILVEKFNCEREVVEEFFARLRSMNFYDDRNLTTRSLFEKYFPGRNDITRFLLEPIAYANGSTLDDPALTYGIVFSNFMSKGVYVFKGGTDVLIDKMVHILENNKVDLRKLCMVEKIIVENGECKGVVVNGTEVRSKVVISNASLKGTIDHLIGKGSLSKDFINKANEVKVNHSSTQVYMGVKKGESIPNIGDLLFTSTHPDFSSTALLDKEVTSRTFSMYYPDMRPQKGNSAIVSSTNAHYEDWNDLSKEEYEAEKEKLIEETLVALEKFIPDIRSKIDHIEAATPCTVEHYTQHVGGSSFGTKFEGLEVSERLPEEIPGCYHAGSVGIIMSGWLGAINYGVIVANKADQYLRKSQSNGDES